MTATVENIGPCRKRLAIKVPFERVNATRAELLREFRKVAAIPGFRPGKAPEPLVEKRYAKEIDDELRHRLIPDTYRKALQEHKLKVVGLPHIESVNYQPGHALHYVATVDTAPEFTLPEYKGIPLQKKEVAVTDEDVAKMLDSIREHNANFVSVEGRPLQMGDYAIVTYSGVADGQPITVLAPDAKTLGENKDFWLLIEKDSFLPGFCEQLVGASVGEKRQVLVNFAPDFPQAGLAGRKATYFVEVRGIREKKLAELTDEFAKQMGAEDVAKLQQQVREVLTADRRNEQESELRKQAVDYLLRQVEFELPESLVRQETRQIVYDVVRDNTIHGASKEQLAEKKDEIFGFAQQSAKERLRVTFILEAIADAEKIEVEEADIDQRVAAMAQRYHTTPERVRAQLEERDAWDDLRSQIRVSKALELIVANARIDLVT